ncbi:hypothetical protein O0Q50_22650 [Priestia aryabhattai]|uniref:Uncharacterized protein n=1 Tax=Priestia aryabhattai TaxID=412384 RepID=A0AAX6NEQ8_PRIAR|nr:hypothetical protein [Priestia aryabhattai]MDU9693985.1 hypothetical protein [Priestia aryabhattai]
MKDIVKAILFGFIAICVVGLGFVGYYVYEVFLKETPVLTDRSKEQTASIKIVQTGEPSFFGPTSIRAYYQKDNGYEDSKTGTLYNDGGPATSNNFSIKWQDEDNVTITLNSENGSTLDEIIFK